MADEKFSDTNYSYRTIVDSTEKGAIALAKRHGGRVAGDQLFVKAQAAVPAEFEIWDDYGSSASASPSPINIGRGWAPGKSRHRIGAPAYRQGRQRAEATRQRSNSREPAPSSRAASCPPAVRRISFSTAS